FRQLLKLSPSGTSQYLEAQFYVAACDFYLNRIKESKAGFELVLGVNPDHVFAHKYLGLVHLSLGELPEALQEFQYVATRSPQDEEANFRTAFLLAKQDRASEAIRYFQRVVEINPANALALNNLALAYQRNKQPDLARQAAERACKLNPKFCNPSR
ncbi:MAG: tetratricopeptide repeat protein, partial [Acidobacteria bacterium]|nr:tetratricopeptide repeat protein [Acidobacteriota bacterium]